MKANGRTPSSAASSPRRALSISRVSQSPRLDRKKAARAATTSSARTSRPTRARFIRGSSGPESETAQQGRRRDDDQYGEQVEDEIDHGHGKGVEELQ